MKEKHLDAKGKGDYNYDYGNDVLTFRIKDQEYKKSIDFENVSIDISKDGFITGLRIFDASKLFRVSKIDLRSLKNIEFRAKSEPNLMFIEIKFWYMRRNKVLSYTGQNWELRDELNLQPTQAVATATA